MIDNTSRTARELRQEVGKGGPTRMPQSHPKSDWRQRGSVRITWDRWYRRLWGWRVGDQPRFTLRFQKPSANLKEYPWRANFVYERFGADDYRLLKQVDNLQESIEGSIIPRAGSVEYSIGTNLERGITPETIITMEVENWDTVWARGWQILAGGVIGAILGRLLP